MNFASDNTAGASLEVLEALMRANDGRAASYGADPWTRRAEELVAGVFEREAAVFLVSTGTAANALGLSAVVPGYGAVICHPESHIMVDECGAPELFTGGAKLVPAGGFAGKMEPAALEAALASLDQAPHTVKPAAVSITQLTEYGAAHTLGEIAEIVRIARTCGCRVHMDGARLANALVALGCTAAEMTWRAGIDVLSFGFTKNGAIAAEAVVFFDEALAGDFHYLRKRGGQLWSKGRFLGAQVVAMLEDGLWLENARHANDMAARLAAGLDAVPGVRLPVPVDGNELFPVLPAGLDGALKAAGALYHPWLPAERPREGVEEVTVRLVTSFATTLEEVDRFLAIARDFGNLGRGTL